MSSKEDKTLLASCINNIFYVNSTAHTDTVIKTLTWPHAQHILHSTTFFSTTVYCKSLRFFFFWQNSSSFKSRRSTNVGICKFRSGPRTVFWVTSKPTETCLVSRLRAEFGSLTRALSKALGVHGCWRICLCGFLWLYFSPSFHHVPEASVSAQKTDQHLYCRTGWENSNAFPETFNGNVSLGSLGMFKNPKQLIYLKIKWKWQMMNYDWIIMLFN